MTDTSALERLVRDTREHPHADFYRTLWGDAPLQALPVTTKEALTQCPLSRRSYKKEQGIVRIVHGSGGPFLSAWAFSDIAQEPYGLTSKRPLIHFTDPHDSVEKSMWAYLNGMVPLSGEKNISVTVLAARAFEVDSLICDPVSIAQLLPYLEERKEPLSSISLLIHEFQQEQLMRYRPLAHTFRLVLALPETGAFAQAELADQTAFTLLENCSIEDGTGTIVLTKNAPLITPIIRYDTGLPVSLIAQK